MEIKAMLTTKASDSGVSLSFGSPGRTVMSDRREKKVKARSIKICIWNVRTMAKAGKIDNAIKEMERMSIDIMGISAIRWSGAGSIDKEEHTVFYSGASDGNPEYGVGMIVTRHISQRVTGFIPVSDRAMLLQIKAHPVNMNIVQIYAPTTDQEDEEVESLYRGIENVIQRFRKHEVNIVMGDFNAKLGMGSKTAFIGPFGLGQRNARGDRLEAFVQNNALVVLNTFY